MKFFLFIYLIYDIFLHEVSVYILSKKKKKVSLVISKYIQVNLIKIKHN